MSNPEFSGTIALDVRDSKEDWEPYLAPKAPEGSPNILFVLYDDTGLGAWSPFGGEIEMPCLKKIAEKGLMIHAMAHGGSLLADPRHAPDRPQPPPQRQRQHHGGGERIPGPARPHAG